PAAHLPLPALPPPPARADRSPTHALAFASPHQVGGALVEDKPCNFLEASEDLRLKLLRGGLPVVPLTRASETEVPLPWLERTASDWRESRHRSLSESSTKCSALSRRRFRASLAREGGPHDAR